VEAAVAAPEQLPGAPTERPEVVDETLPAGSNWVPAPIPELHTAQRGEHWLCLNPGVPSWIITTRAGVLLLKLCDGVRTVRDLATMLQAADVPVDPEAVESFFREAAAAGMFRPARQDNPLHLWDTRRLSAIHLHLTDRCNLQCTYCLRDSSPLVPLRHRPEKFIGMLEYIKPFTAEVLRITFAGGEPLMYPGFSTVVEASTGLGYRNDLLTNGMLVNEARADFIAHHFTKVRISLDGPSALTHAQGRGDNFDKVVRGVRLLADRMDDVTVQVTVGSWNVDVAQDVRSVVPDNVKVAYTPVLPFGRGKQQAKVFISNEQFLSLSRRVSAASSEPVESMFRPGERNRSCHAGLANLSIADTGDVYPCHLFHEEQFHFGNIFHDSFEDIFFGPRIRNYVLSMDVEHNNSICSACEVRFLCGGGCKANPLHGTGDHHGVDLYCGFIKASIEDNLFASLGCGTSAFNTTEASVY